MRHACKLSKHFHITFVIFMALKTEDGFTQQSLRTDKHPIKAAVR